MLFELGQRFGDDPRDSDMPRLLRLMELFRDHLLVHEWAEENFLYPAVRAVLPKAPQPLCLRYMDQLDHEHNVLKAAIDRLEMKVRRHPSHPGWPAAYVPFFQGMQTHMRKEEEQLFPLAERMLGVEELETLSRILEDNHYKVPPVRLHTQVS